MELAGTTLVTAYDIYTSSQHDECPESWTVNGQLSGGHATLTLSDVAQHDCPGSWGEPVSEVLHHGDRSQPWGPRMYQTTAIGMFDSLRFVFAPRTPCQSIKVYEIVVNPEGYVSPLPSAVQEFQRELVFRQDHSYSQVDVAIVGDLCSNCDNSTAADEPAGDVIDGAVALLSSQNGT
eukprot:SAG31_NODE_14262_length_818_cov_0.634214_1_plen_177_part_10